MFYARKPTGGNDTWYNTAELALAKNPCFSFLCRFLPPLEDFVFYGSQMGFFARGMDLDQRDTFSDETVLDISG